MPSDTSSDYGDEQLPHGRAASADFDARRPADSLTEAQERTRERVGDLRDLFVRYGRRHLPERTTSAEPAPAPPKQTGAHARALRFLQLVPWVLALLFALSFAWDFDGLVLTLVGYPLPLDGLLRILAVSGLIGFATNWLAITMLFNPREKRPIFGQGLIPAQRERVIFRLAKAVSEELINEEIIKQRIEDSGIIPRYRHLLLRVSRGVIEDPEFRREFKDLVGAYVEEVLSSEEVQERLSQFIVRKLEESTREGLTGLALRAYRLVGEDDFRRRVDRAVREIPKSVDPLLDELDRYLDRLPVLLRARSGELEAWATRMVLGFVEQIDVYRIITENMDNYDEAQLENLLKRTSNEQLNYIKYLGGILGFLGGLVIWKPVLALSTFTAVGLALYGIDEALYRAGKARG